MYSTTPETFHHQNGTFRGIIGVLAKRYVIPFEALDLSSCGWPILTSSEISPRRIA